MEVGDVFGTPSPNPLELSDDDMRVQSGKHKPHTRKHIK